MPKALSKPRYSPGAIQTAMQAAIDAQFAKLQARPAEVVRAERLGRIPLGYSGEPEVVAGVVSFLVGHDGRYLTGQALKADGGILT